MTVELARVDEVGTLAWLERSGGELSRAERSYLLRGMFPMIRDGFRLRRHARRSGLRDVALGAFERPDTAIVAAAHAHLTGSSGPEMANHCYRTAFWTLAVLHQHADITPTLIETVWVAALLHDVGLDVPPPRGDFSATGVQLVDQLARDHGWPEDQAHDAAQAIAVNLTTRADPAKVGMVAWAMNAGGAAELGIWPHRAQLSRNRIRELERRFPRDRFRAVAMHLIRREAERIPRGRFALFKPIYWMLMR